MKCKAQADVTAAGYDLRCVDEYGHEEEAHTTKSGCKFFIGYDKRLGGRVVTVELRGERV